MSYFPNVNDPRTYRRIISAIGFAKGCFSSTKPHGWGTRYIDKHFGSANHDLSKWLRKHLLIVSDERYSPLTGKCKEYLLNESGLLYVIDVLSGTHLTYSQWLKTFSTEGNVHRETLPPSVLEVEFSNRKSKIDTEKIVNDWIKNEFGKELLSLNFNYLDKSNRLWHPLQHVRKEYKRRALAEAGLIYEYDIQACAPTLLHQYSQRLPLKFDENGRYVHGPMDLYLHGLRSYLDDKEGFRNKLAFDAQIPLDIVKKIINALFNGAKLSANPKTTINTMVNGNIEKIMFLKQYQPLTELRNDIKTVWKYIKPHINCDVIVDSKGRKRKLPISSRKKWALYFALERQVLNVVHQHLLETKNAFFSEHDGWSTKNPIDIPVLIDKIKTQTGYDIKVDVTNFVP